jgi:hypothetical protein
VAFTQASPLSALTILYGTSFLSFGDGRVVEPPADQALDGEKVFSGLVTAWRLAGWPTSARRRR